MGKKWKPGVVYPDTDDGAVAMLRADPPIPRYVIDNATYEADPLVNGCWKATFDKTDHFYADCAIIYGLGTPDSDTELCGGCC